MAEIFSSDNPLFASFIFYCAVLIIKMMFVQFNTVFHRITKNIFISEEDVKFADPSGKKIKMDPFNPVVERTRRAHLNDIENIVPFMFLGLFYITTQPAYATAIMVFRVFTAARFVHTIVYLGHIRQPFRVLSFVVGVFVNIFMAVRILMFYGK